MRSDIEQAYQSALMALQAGDWLLRTGNTWSLMRAGYELAPCVAERLLSPVVGLQPNKDGLPTFDDSMSQTWSFKAALV